MNTQLATLDHRRDQMVLKCVEQLKFNKKTQFE